MATEFGRRQNLYTKRPQHHRHHSAVCFAATIDKNNNTNNDEYSEGTTVAKVFPKSPPLAADWPPPELPTVSTDVADTARVKLFICCLSIPLMDCARFVGWLSTVPLLIALLLLPFASTFYELLPELLLLGSEMVCVLSLFFGLQNQQPNYLRPFLAFGLVWNLALLLLLLFSVIELLVARDRFCAQILLTLRALLLDGGTNDETAQVPTMASIEELLDEYGEQIVALDQLQYGEMPNPSSSSSLSPLAPLLLALTFVALLALTIVVNAWLLNIVLLAYLHMKRAQHRVGRPYWPEKCAEMRQSLLTPRAHRQSMAFLNNRPIAEPARASKRKTGAIIAKTVAEVQSQQCHCCPHQFDDRLLRD